MASNNGPTQKDLALVASEMNEVMGLDPAIDTSQKKADLKKEIEDSAPEIHPEDNFSDEAWQTLEAIGAASRPQGDEGEEEAEGEAEEPEDEGEEEPEAGGYEDEDEEEEEEEPEPEPAPEPKQEKKGKQEAKGGSSGKGQAPAKAGGEGKPGVVDSIAEFLKATSKKKGITKDEILGKLQERFPERDPNSMKGTVDVQVPTQLRKKKGLNVRKIDGGGYYIGKETEE